MIKFDAVSKAYANSQVYAVQNVSFEARPGEIFGFLGPNGAGKTTSIKMMTGLLKPTSGTITICDRDVVKEPVEAKKSLAFVPDDQVLFEQLTGREYVNFLADIYGVSLNDRTTRTQSTLEKFGLTKDFDSAINTYSHGMKQKIAIIGALVHDPSVWILDEPMTGLDAQSAFELKQMMREHADQHKTVLFSTHVLEVAEKVCDRIGIINHGRMLAVGTIDEMHQAFGLDLEESFLRIIKLDDERIRLAGEAATPTVVAEGFSSVSELLNASRTEDRSEKEPTRADVDGDGFSDAPKAGKDE